MRHTCAIAVIVLAALVHAGRAHANVLLTDDFEDPGEWKKTINGTGRIELAADGASGKALKVTCKDGATAFYTTSLPLEHVRGKRLTVRAKVRIENVAQGSRRASTAKIRVTYRDGKMPQHQERRFLGTMDWRDQLFVAPIPAAAEKVTLALGIQNASGTVWFDDLVVDDGVREHESVSLRAAANTGFRDDVAGDGRGFIDTGPDSDLRHLPLSDVRLGDVDFHIMGPRGSGSRNCVVLRGGERPNLPARIERPIAVGKKASRLFFLHAAAWTKAGRKTPCLVYTIAYEDGKTIDVPMREGADIGAFENPRDLKNWKVAWTRKQDGRTVGLGVTTWRNERPDVPIQSIRLATPGTGGVPILVAISLDGKRE